MLFSTVLAALSFTAVISSPVQAEQAGAKGLARRPVNKGTLKHSLATLKTEIQQQGDILKSALEQVDTKDPANVAATAAPVLKSIDAAIKQSQKELALGGSHKKRQLENVDIEEVAQDIADVVKALLTALGPLQNLIQQLPILGSLLGPFLSPIGIDLAIVLGGLGIVLTGVLALVADLLSALGGALGGLGLGPVTGVLGI